MNYHQQKTQWLFPVPIWSFGLPDCEEVNRSIQKRVYELASTEGSRNASNEGGWHSKGNMRDDPVIEPVTKFIEWAVKQLSDESGMTYRDYDFFIWANLNRPYDYNVVHNHPGSHLSGVYYVKLPEGDCGNFRMYNPMFSYEYFSKSPKPPFQQARAELKGKEGALLIFRSPILHDVARNNTSEDRISLAFNIALKS